MVENEPLIPKHGGYRNLKSFQIAQLVYDLTVRFCERYVARFSRTRDQMVRAARCGVQNIDEGSQASGTSRKTELKLTNVARASLEELRLDYEDFLRQRWLAVWVREGPRRASLIARRCTTADDASWWAKAVHDGLSAGSTSSTTNPEIVANAALVLIAVAFSLLDRQIAAQSEAFEKEGGFTEHMYRVRTFLRKSLRAGTAIKAYAPKRQ